MQIPRFPTRLPRRRERSVAGFFVLLLLTLLAGTPSCAPLPVDRTVGVDEADGSTPRSAISPPRASPHSSTARASRGGGDAGPRILG